VPTVGIIGAGTMGAGIAQVASMHGWTVELMDLDQAVARQSIDGIGKRLDRLVEKGRLDGDQRAAVGERLCIATGLACLSGCDLVIEAVVEDLDVKVQVFDDVKAVLRPDAILASNTSSLSISKLGAASGEARRLLGMHFFNPVPLMPLVEIIAGRQSDRTTVDRAAEIATGWGKTVVRAGDTPGFIVNRVARGYYLESLRILGEGVAGVDEIDQVLRKLGGFRMGPFELMDLVGIDVNYTVSCSVWEQLGKPARLTPHPIQKDLFDRGQFGRKSKQGFYGYHDETPLPAVPVERGSYACPPTVYKAVRLFADRATEAAGSITEQYVFARVLAAIINEAAMLLDEGVATGEDIDTAMKTGTNYPYGPLEWAERIGRHTCRHLLDALNGQVEDGRFAPANWLQT
jgi:3-hydroxybutyryl-CoA dehydrogenase